MKLTLTLDLTSSRARILNDWASVGRTFDAAIKRLHDDLDMTSDVEVADDIAHEVAELEDLKDCLNDLHHQVRTKLWEITGGVNGKFPK